MGSGRRSIVALSHDSCPRPLTLPRLHCNRPGKVLASRLAVILSTVFQVLIARLLSTTEWLDNALGHLGTYELRGDHVSEWSSADHNQITSTPIAMNDFSCKIFVRCKSAIRGEDVFSGLTSTNLAAGTIRALVQQYQPFKPIAKEAAPVTWWRSRLKEDPFECWGQYRERSDFSLDVMSPYAKVSLKRAGSISLSWRLPLSSRPHTAQRVLIGDSLHLAAGGRTLAPSAFFRE